MDYRYQEIDNFKYKVNPLAYLQIVYFMFPLKNSDNSAALNPK